MGRSRPIRISLDSRGPIRERLPSIILKTHPLNLRIKLKFSQRLIRVELILIDQKMTFLFGFDILPNLRIFRFFGETAENFFDLWDEVLLTSDYNKLTQ